MIFQPNGGAGGGVETVTGTISANVIIGYFDGEQYQTNVKTAATITVQKGTIVVTDKSYNTSGGIGTANYFVESWGAWESYKFDNAYIVTGNFEMGG